VNFASSGWASFRNSSKLVHAVSTIRLENSDYNLILFMYHSKYMVMKQRFSHEEVNIAFHVLFQCTLFSKQKYRSGLRFASHIREGRLKHASRWGKSPYETLNALELRLPVTFPHHAKRNTANVRVSKMNTQPGKGLFVNLPSPPLTNTEEWRLLFRLWSYKKYF